MRDSIKFMRDKMWACDVHFRENLYITFFFRYNNKPYIATRVLEILEGTLVNLVEMLVVIYKPVIKM